MVAYEVFEHSALRVTFNYVSPALHSFYFLEENPTFLPICTAAIIFLRSVVQGESIDSKAKEKKLIMKTQVPLFKYH